MLLMEILVEWLATLSFGAEIALNKAPSAVYFYDQAAGEWRNAANPSGDAGDDRGGDHSL